MAIPKEHFSGSGDCATAWFTFPKRQWRAYRRYVRYLKTLAGGGGPGQTFVRDPRIRRSHTRVLVTQFRGVNV